jgi:hypothetical protein
LFIVVKYPVPFSELPDECGDVAGYRFFVEEADGSIRELRGEGGVLKNPEFSDRLYHPDFRFRTIATRTIYGQWFKYRDASE